VEYSLILALLAVVAMAGLTVFQASTANLYETVMQASQAMIDAVS
jgi:Flp pilus assembly pilin Flp